jgi:pilus assembly protein CpaE
MFSAMLFAQDRVGSKTIERIALESRDICIYKTMHVFPTSYVLTRLMNTFKPDLIFVELSPLEDALVLARTARVLARHTAVIGYLWKAPDPEVERACDAGVLEILPSPLTREGLQGAVERAVSKARPELQDNLLAFMPAKAGSGATTVAIQVAGCLARDLDKKVLMIDADLHSGLVGVLLKVQAEYSIVHALENAAQLDGTLWGRIVTQAHGLDLLLTPQPIRPAAMSWGNYHQLLQFVRGRYDEVVVDLPEVVNDATGEIVRRAKRVFLVTTPELPALVLARQRCSMLEERGVPPHRVEIIVNRWKETEIAIQEIERLLQERVAAVFHNDYQCVRRAIQEGRLLGPKSVLGRAFAAFAGRLSGVTPQEEERSRAGSFLGSLMPR